MLREKYDSYESALMSLNLDSLEDRRKVLTLKFAKAGIKHEKLNDLLQENVKNHEMKTRGNEKYDVTFANTERLKNSSIITMQNMLNTDYENNKTRNCG